MLHLRAQRIDEDAFGGGIVAGVVAVLAVATGGQSEIDSVGFVVVEPGHEGDFRCSHHLEELESYAETSPAAAHVAGW
ncbi:MAG: hypothetical protein L0H12_03900 [Nitrosospira sp.]|nr:hypothetical protein [Nitrosospira sp.]